MTRDGQNAEFSVYNAHNVHNAHYMHYAHHAHITYYMKLQHNASQNYDKTCL